MVVNSSNVAEAATLLVAYYTPLLWNSTSIPSLWESWWGIPKTKKRLGALLPAVKP